MSEKNFKNNLYNIIVENEIQIDKDTFLRKGDRIILESNEEYVLYYKDKWIIDTKHYIQRKLQRKETDLSKKEIETIFRRIIDYYWDFPEQFKYKNQYLFYSIQYRQAFIVDFREDTKHKVRGNNFILITFLPRNKHNVRDDGTEKKFIESINENALYTDKPFSESLLDYMNFLMNYYKTNVKESDKTLDFCKYKLTEDFEVYTTKGEFFHTNIDIIEID